MVHTILVNLNLSLNPNAHPQQMQEFCSLEGLKCLPPTSYPPPFSQPPSPPIPLLLQTPDPHHTYPLSALGRPASPPPSLGTDVTCSYGIVAHEVVCWIFVRDIIVSFSVAAASAAAAAVVVVVVCVILFVHGVILRVILLYI